MSELPYREETPDHWVDEVASTWSVDQSGDTVSARGTCPTCDHRTASTFTRLRASKSVGGRIAVIVYCQCQEPHPGRPPHKNGCGRQGQFLLELD